MKTKILILLLFCLPINALWSQNTKADLQELKENYKKFSNASNTYDQRDSIYYFEKDFYNSILKVLQKDFKATFKQLPQLLKDGNHITYLSSTDQKLHFICWDDGSGGTMRNATCIVAYESKGKYVVENFYKESEKNSFNSFVNELHQVQGKNGPVYLIFNLFVGSSAMYYPSCKTITIENGTLNKKAKYIKTLSGLNNTISYEVDFSRKYYRDNPHINIPIENIQFKYVPNIKSFHFPVVLESGAVETKRIYYQFDGQYFVKKM